MFKKNRPRFPFGLPLAIDQYLIDDKKNLFYQDYPAVCLVIHGEILVQRLGHTHKYYAGDVLVIDAESPAVIESTGDQEVSLLVLSLNIDHFQNEYPFLSTTIFPNVTFERNDHLRSLLLDISLTVIEKGIDGYKSLQNLIVELIEDLISITISNLENSNQNNVNPEHENDHKTLLFLELIEYLGSNFSYKATLKSFSEEKHLTSNYVSHMIKKNLGVTFQSLLSLIRCRKSEPLLLDIDYRINEISYDVGFSSPKYYKESFKGFFNISPSDYRELYAETRLNTPESIGDSLIIKNNIREFSDRSGVKVSSMADTIYSRNIISIDRSVEKYENLLSDMGRISNIKTEMTESARQAFDEMHRVFRMSIITIDAGSSLIGSSNTTFLTISRNINYLINLGFGVGLETKEITADRINLLGRFLLFYSRIYHDNASLIKIIIRTNEKKSRHEIIRDDISKRIYRDTGIMIDVIVASEYVDEIDFYPAVYDSFVLTPFAMDELFNPENWPKEIAFSLIDEVNSAGLFLDGGNGLLTWNGIKKPWWYAYSFVAKLGGNIIDKGNDHIVTNDNGRIAILSYNLCGRNPALIKKITTRDDLIEEIELTNQLRREHSFHLKEVYGSYKMTSYRIDSRSCLFSMWESLDFPSFLTGEEEEIMSTTCHPEIDFKRIDAAGFIDVTTREDSYGVSLVVLEKTE